jgi:N-acetylneuraminic acid mutarotase
MSTLPFGHIRTARYGGCADPRSGTGQSLWYRDFELMTPLYMHISRRRFIIGGGAMTAAALLACRVSLAPAQPLGTWTTRALMPSSRGEVAAAVVGGRIHIVGAYSDGSNLNEAYDPTTDLWQTLAPLPRGVHHTSAASIGDRLYVAGGYDTSTNRPITSAWVYDPVVDQWASIAPLTSPRGALGMVASGDRLYAIGGEAGRNVPANEMYSPEEDRWYAARPLPTRLVRSDLRYWGPGNQYLYESHDE